MITGRKLPDSQVVYTLDGPVASFLWGRKQIKMDGEFALIPLELVDRYKKAIGRDPSPMVLESGL